MKHTIIGIILISVMAQCALAAFPTNHITDTVDIAPGRRRADWGDFKWTWRGYESQQVTLTIENNETAVDMSGYFSTFRLSSDASSTGQVDYIDKGTNEVTVTQSNLVITVAYTNIPPNGTYKAEWLLIDAATPTVAKSIAQGKIKVQQSIYGTSSSDYTYPTYWTIGIADNNLLTVDGTPGSGEYARFTANGLEGRTEAEFKADFNCEAGTDFVAWDATLDDIADGTIAENLVNTANPWADNEVSDTLTVTGYMQDEDINTFAELQAWVTDKTLVNEEDVFTIDANWVNTANPWADNEVSDTLTVTGYMQDEDINTFAELQAWVSDKTLVNEEDAFTIDANWVNTANPWADNEVADNLTVDDAGIAATIARDSEVTTATSTLHTAVSAEIDSDITTATALWNTRDKVEAVWAGTTTIWCDDNDGAASGMDADKLDGQEGIYYLDCANMTGTLVQAVQDNITYLGALAEALDLNGQQLNFGGDDDTYLVQTSDDLIKAYLANTWEWSWHATYFGGTSTGDPYLDADGGSWDIQYTFTGDVDTGMKRTAANTLALIAGTAGSPSTNLIVTATAVDIHQLLDMNAKAITNVTWISLATGPAVDTIETTLTEDDTHIPTSDAVDDYCKAGFQPLEATLTDIADGTIAEDLVNTANPWADNEVADNITASSYLPLAGGTMSGNITMPDDGWVGLGAAKSRVVWLDEAVDQAQFLTSLVKIGDGTGTVATAAEELYVKGDIETDANLDVGGTGAFGHDLSVTCDDPMLTVADNDGTIRHARINISTLSGPWYISSGYSDGSLNGQLHFNFNGTTAATTLMTIRNDGKVGIGTNAPATKLDVDGNATIRGSVTLDSGATVDNIETTATDDDTHILTSGAVVDYAVTAAGTVYTNTATVTIGGSVTNFSVDVSNNCPNVVRGWVYIGTTNNMPYSQTIELTFYENSTRTGKDAAWRADMTILGNKLNGAMASGTNVVVVDDASDFSADDLVRFTDDGEYGRIDSIDSNDITLEDNVAAGHADNSGLSLCPEFGGFFVYDQTVASTLWGAMATNSAVDLTITVKHK